MVQTGTTEDQAFFIGAALRGFYAVHFQTTPGLDWSVYRWSTIHIAMFVSSANCLLWHCPSDYSPHDFFPFFFLQVSDYPGKGS